MKRTVILLVILALLVGGLAGCKKTAAPPAVGTRGTIERTGVIDVNGDGIVAWNGGTIATYSDAGDTLTWSITGSTGDLVAGDTIVFEGATADGYETTFAITDPTSSDKTITFPNSTGTVALNPYGASIEFEGATADGFETTLAVADTTDPDKTITLPDSDGTVMLSTLATNGPQAANAVWGASNGLVFEGATGGADAYETTITPTDPTADRTVTLQDATGTVALTSQAVDMTLTADATGGNAGAKTEYIGLPRIKLIGGAAGTNPGSQTIALVDDTPDGEWAAVDASVILTADTSYYKHGAKSLKAVWDVGAVATDGFKDANLGAGAAWDDMESVGLLVYSTATWAAGDLTLVLTDDGGARTFDIPALATANKWTWLEVNIATGDLSAVSDVAILMSAAGETALGAFSMYVDIGYTWDALDQEELGVDLVQDGVLGVINTVTGAPLVELTDYIIHYDVASTDAIVYITDQSAAGIAVLAAY